MQREKIVSISGLRGFSCLIIMLYHYRFFLLDNGLRIIDYGHYFVEVFVMISGFLMAYNYRNRIAGMNFKDFFLNRYMKIMPLYWITEICVYAAVILATVLSGEKYKWNPIQMLWELSGIYTGWFGQSAPPMNPPLWTVCCLLLCYILYYLICKVSKNCIASYIGMIMVIIFVGAFSIASMIYEGRTYSIIGSEDSLRCIISFMMGLLLYELYQKMPDWLGKVISYILIGMFIGIIAAFSNFPLTKGIDVENLIPGIVILLFCPLMLYSAIYIKPLKYLFSSRVLQFIGKISMDIYMWHWVVRIYLGSRPFYVDQNTWSGWILLIIASLTVSILSHYIMARLYSVGANIKTAVLGNRYSV